MDFNTSRTIALSGAKDTLPLVLAAMPFALVFGALGQAQGLADWLVMAISVFVFAGASQFIAVTMLATGAGFPVIILTVFIVNLRHILYGVSLIPIVRHLPQKWRAPMAFTLTDETFAVVFNKLSHNVSHNNNLDSLPVYYLGSSFFMYINWILCTWLGILAGNQLPSLTSFGLDIAMVVAFIGIVIPNLKLPSHWLCMLIAGISGIITFHWPHQTGLLFSTLLAIVIGVVAENTLTIKTSVKGKAHE